MLRDPLDGDAPWLFGKANGLGDMELGCNNAPIEIGNRVWDDVDKDGIQDAGEVGISGITVTLYAADGTTVVATAMTDTNGNYFFSSASGTNSGSAKYNLGLNFNTNYILSFPTSTSGKNLTSLNVGSNDLLDSDPNKTTGKLTFTTGYAGQNNHSYDAGYAIPDACTIDIVCTPVDQSSCILANCTTYS